MGVQAWIAYSQGRTGSRAHPVIESGPSIVEIFSIFSIKNIFNFFNNKYSNFFFPIENKCKEALLWTRELIRTFTLF